MSRAFSTAARSLLRIIWKGSEAIPKYDEMIKEKIQSNPKLNGRAERVELALVLLAVQIKTNGTEHVSNKDSKLRVSGQIYTEDGARLTSGHWYHDGQVSYSKEPYNETK
ncbi:uncharacterized protein N7511_000556 [Penicillium nucicola]|uniref:uncharacterized protein n=1 Tax=Penicillium nucicola TaxID=1850975 RepID=UPI0025456BA4|nr:uncharacterized protein N7511_000556 [Penicillium nucicola]KAJ5775545.1 hypothetical protein N7511_000556 [Penicillium nucicola]